MNAKESELNDWKKIFNEYEEVNFFKAPLFESILEEKTWNVHYGDCHGYGDTEYYSDEYRFTNFYNFSNLNKALVLEERISSGKVRTIKCALYELIQSGEKITHIVRAEENCTERGTFPSKVEIYELGNELPLLLAYNKKLQEEMKNDS